ncbi:MAG: tetratricopeptide repeat protein [Promethearchaeota archaeon]
MGKKIKCPICERKISINLELCKFCGMALSMEKRLIPKRREEYKLERAKILFRRNEPFIALDYLNEILEESPQSVAALELSGAIYNTIGLPPRGLERFNKLVSIEPTNSEAWKNIALCYLNTFKY